MIASVLQRRYHCVDSEEEEEEEEEEDAIIVAMCLREPALPPRVSSCAVVCADPALVSCSKHPHPSSCALMVPKLKK